MGVYEGVRETIYRFAWAYDEIDVDGYVDTFLEDGEQVVVSSRGLLRLAGRSAIREFFPKARGNRTTQGQQPRHLINNILVTETAPGKATSKCYMTFIRTHSDGSAAVDHAGRYLDDLELDQGVWRFRQRRILMDRDQAFTGRHVVWFPT